VTTRVVTGTPFEVHVAMIRWMVICLAFTGCAGSEAEGDHLIVHVTCTRDFDELLVSDITAAPIDVPVGPSDHYDWDYWETFTGDGPESLSITVLAGGNAIATGTASQIAYIDQGDGSRRAEITLPLTP
jgi:hypothetical protein